MKRLVIGRRGPEGAEVVLEVDGKQQPLPPRFDLSAYDPTIFEWGYGGNGPDQLALAILCQVCSDHQAIVLHQVYKWNTVARLPYKGWRIDLEHVAMWVHSMGYVADKARNV